MFYSIANECQRSTRNLYSFVVHTLLLRTKRLHALFIMVFKTNKVLKLY